MLGSTRFQTTRNVENCSNLWGTGPIISLVSVTVDNGSARFDVRDRGPGIPRNLAAAVFSPFERGAHADDPSPGLGLGLSLSRGLARELGGDLELVETNGDGACFRLSLPLARPT